MPKRTIAVFTGNRSEYGLLYPVLKVLQESEDFEVALLVSGAHLKLGYGQTLSEIEADGIRVAAHIPILEQDDGIASTAAAIGATTRGVAEALAALRPDLMMAYGDRFESFGAIIASTQMALPTAHIEGGDYTEGGALDDSVRHAMTKLSHLHFVTHAEAAERVLRLGEEPWRIHNVGLPALDLIRAGAFASPEEVFQRLPLDRKRPLLLFTQHAVATEASSVDKQIRACLDALSRAVIRWGCQVIATYPNDDAGGRVILDALRAFAEAHPADVVLRASLGRHLYHGVLNIVAACVGNSSSGIKETPAFHLPTVNIGDRQKGRRRSSNVLDAPCETEAILSTLDHCLHDAEFIEAAATCINPYGDGTSGLRIADILRSAPLDLHLIQKRMTY